MKSTLLRTYSYFPIIIVLFLLNGCMHGGRQGDLPDPQTQKIITSIENTNSELKTFKGIGSVKLADGTQNSSFRLAWAGKAPDKLRLIVLISGKPIETIAANGKTLFLKSHTGAHQFFQKKSKNASLEKLISIPVKAKEVIDLLSGKIPMTDYKYAQLVQVPDSNRFILELSRPWRGVVERIFLNNNKTVAGFEMVKNGHSTYRVSLNNFKNINEFTIPYEIIFESKKSMCKIIVTNYFINPETVPATFELSPE